MARALSEADYAAWLSSARANGVPWGDAVRDALAEPATKAALARRLGLEPTAPPGSPAEALTGENAQAANEAYAAFTIADVPPDLFAEAVGRYAHGHAGFGVPDDENLCRASDTAIATTAFSVR